MKNKFNGCVIIDAGHGPETPGKRSPVWADGAQLLEWEFNRKVANRLRTLLACMGVTALFVHDENEDTPLSVRVNRANRVYQKAPDSFLVSIHANAGGGTGWECYTSPGKTKSDQLASFFCYEADKQWSPEWKMRFDDSDGDPDKEESFYILTKTNCPAVLTENFFMDTERDCRYLLSNKGIEEIAKVHYRAILDYLNENFA